MLVRIVTLSHYAIYAQGIFQAAYTAGAVLPRPVARCRYDKRIDDKEVQLLFTFTNASWMILLNVCLHINHLLTLHADWSDTGTAH